MPIYTFKDTRTDEHFEEVMSYDEKVRFLEACPDITAVLDGINIVAGVGMSTRIKNDDGWNENLQRIAEAHPTSAIADRYVRKTAKEAKTENAVAKWRNTRQLTQ
jgi:hypothetical protein